MNISYLFIFFLITISLISCDEHDHKVKHLTILENQIRCFQSVQYEDGHEVVLWMNTVGPYHNRQETYNYFSLPFCRGSKKELSHYHETLGENILGVELEYSGIEINFKRKFPHLSN